MDDNEPIRRTFIWWGAFPSRETGPHTPIRGGGPQTSLPLGGIAPRRPLPATEENETDGGLRPFRKTLTA